MMAVVGTLSFNFQVLLPLLASFTWHGTASTLHGARRGDGRRARWPARWPPARAAASDRELLVGAAAALRRRELLVAAAPTIALQLLALIPLGAVSVTFAAGVNSVAAARRRARRCAAA